MDEKTVQWDEEDDEWSECQILSVAASSLNKEYLN